MSAGVVDQHIDLTPGVNNVVHDIGGRPGVGDVGTHRLRLPARSGYRGHNFLCRRLIAEVSEHHAETALGKQLDDGAANAARTTGDQCNFVIAHCHLRALTVRSFNRFASAARRKGTWGR